MSSKSWKRMECKYEIAGCCEIVRYTELVRNSCYSTIAPNQFDSNSQNNMRVIVHVDTFLGHGMSKGYCCSRTLRKVWKMLRFFKNFAVSFPVTLHGRTIVSTLRSYALGLVYSTVLGYIEPCLIRLTKNCAATWQQHTRRNWHNKKLCRNMATHTRRNWHNNSAWPGNSSPDLSRRTTELVRVLHPYKKQCVREVFAVCSAIKSDVMQHDALFHSRAPNCSYAQK